MDKINHSNLAKTIRIREWERLEALNKLSLTDHKTGLFNRRGLDSEIGPKLVAQALRSNEDLCVAFVDLDSFKPVNDRIKHVLGDKLLGQIFLYFKENVREGDTVFRYGGDEAVILFPRANKEQADEVIKRLALSLNKFLESVEFINTEEAKNISFSVGLSSISEDLKNVNNDINNTEIIRHLVDLADQRMYKDKNNKKSKDNV